MSFKNAIERILHVEKIWKIWGQLEDLGSKLNYTLYSIEGTG